MAFSIIDLRRTEQWFREGLGFAPAGGTQLTWRIRFRPRLPGSGALLRRLLRRMLADALARLKPIIESSDGDTYDR